MANSLLYRLYPFLKNPIADAPAQAVYPYSQIQTDGNKKTPTSGAFLFQAIS